MRPKAGVEDELFSDGRSICRLGEKSSNYWFLLSEFAGFANISAFGEVVWGYPGIDWGYPGLDFG